MADLSPEEAEILRRSIAMLPGEKTAVDFSALLQVGQLIKKFSLVSPT